MVQTKLTSYEERAEKELLIAQKQFILTSKNHIVISNSMRLFFWITIIGSLGLLSVSGII